MYKVVQKITNIIFRKKMREVLLMQKSLPWCWVLRDVASYKVVMFALASAIKCTPGKRNRRLLSKCILCVW